MAEVSFFDSLPELLAADGRLREKVERALARLAACDLCPHRCLVDRLRGERGVCRTDRYARVASAAPHFGEERPLVGLGGSGTIFFSCCNLACLYCQNADISQSDHGEEVSAGELAAIMLSLQRSGCENINLVSPSHVIPQILEALAVAVGGGLNLPLVYNTGGYDAVDALRLLDGVVDIYMPDMKYGTAGGHLSNASDYAVRNREAVVEMHRQVGDLELDRRGVAWRGLLVRHLVLPGDLAESAAVASFLADRVSTNTYVNVMDQYRPHHRAHEVPALSRRPTADEHRAAVAAFRRAGLNRLDGYL
ncbi:MAG: 4Fe-4S cluster-binding domain-containing protein [Thermoleophilia bacterium]